jgi:zinc/manganese transport system permease protein
VQLVGVYLVFASLIMPALATSRLKIAYLVGMVGYGMGLILSNILDLPAGAMIVLMLAISSIIAFLLRKTITI